MTLLQHHFYAMLFKSVTSLWPCCLSPVIKQVYEDARGHNNTAGLSVCAKCFFLIQWIDKNFIQNIRKDVMSHISQFYEWVISISRLQGAKLFFTPAKLTEPLNGFQIAPYCLHKCTTFIMKTGFHSLWTSNSLTASVDSPTWQTQGF